MARIGILGYPNVGKTTLFNALCGLDAPTAPHPYSTHEPNVGVARIPDVKLDEAGRLEGSAKVVHAALELFDIPAIARPGHGEGLAAQFLGRLREADTVVGVLRAFDDPSVPDDESGTDPAEQAEALMLELTVADADVFERKRERIVKEASADPAKRHDAEVIVAAAQHLAAGRPLRTGSWADPSPYRDLAPLTAKPAVWVINTGEDEPDPGPLVEAVAGVVPDGDEVVALCATLEAEAMQLPPEERDELYEGLGMGEGALTRVVHAVHRASGLISFYTLGSREAHAWTVPAGTTTRQAAGKVHTDFERGFIRAEVAQIDAVLSAGGWDAAKHQGLVRVEGKDHVLEHGDVMLVRFSV